MFNFSRNNRKFFRLKKYKIFAIQERIFVLYFVVMVG